MSRLVKKKYIYILVIGILIISGLIISRNSIRRDSYIAIEEGNTEENGMEIIRQEEEKSEFEINYQDEKERNEFEGIEVTNDDIGVTVLGYHSIADEFKDDPLVVDKEVFRGHLQTIKDAGYTTITLDQLYRYLYSGDNIPKKSVVITFDDGYVDNYTNAFPLLKEFGMNATMFVISDYLGRGGYISVNQVKDMSDEGIDIQGHTANHLELDMLTYEEQLREVSHSKKKIEEITGKEVNSIAYLLGKYNDHTLEVVEQAGYNMAFTVKRGQANREDSKYEIDRILIDYTYKNSDIKKVLK